MWVLEVNEGLPLTSQAGAGALKEGPSPFHTLPHRPAVSLEPLMFTLFLPKFKRSSQPCTPSQP